LPAGFPVPVVVLQHMPPGYTRALAEQLARQCALPVLEARHEDALTPGRVLIAPSGHQLAIRKAAHGPARVAIAEAAPYPTFYRPCVDYGFEEAARVYGKGALGVVMTGMGADGARGARAIREAGGACWAQDQATSTIFGMPRAAAEAGAVSWVFPLELLAEGLRVAIGR
jgi:two-component system chemotaxis response regulator CheB